MTLAAALMSDATIIDTLLKVAALYKRNSGLLDSLCTDAIRSDIHNDPEKSRPMKANSLLVCRLVSVYEIFVWSRQRYEMYSSDKI